MTARGGYRALVAPALLLVAVVFLVPFALLVLISFWTQPPGSLLIEPRFTLVNYARIFGDTFYLRGLAVTLWLSALATAISLALGLAMAWWLSRRSGRWRGLATALVLVPLISGALLPTLGLVNLLSTLGVVNGTLRSLGLISSSLNLLGNWTGIVIGLVQGFLPLMVLPLLTVLDRVPREFEEAAMSLGARRRDVWRRVLLPLAMPGILAGSLLVFCASLTSFVTPQILGQGKVATFATMAYQQASLVLDWPFASALAAVMLAILSALTALVWAARRMAENRS